MATDKLSSASTNYVARHYSGGGYEQPGLPESRA